MTGASREVGIICGCQWTAIQHAPNRVLNDEQREFAKTCRTARSHPRRRRGLPAVENAQQAVGKNGFRADRSSNDLSLGREDGLRLVRDFAAKVNLPIIIRGDDLVEADQVPESKPAPAITSPSPSGRKGSCRDKDPQFMLSTGDSRWPRVPMPGRTAVEGTGLQRDRSPRFSR